MLTRRGLYWTARFRPIAEAVAALPARNGYVDGEATVLDENGVSVFAELQDALSAGSADRITYHVFDLLWLDGKDLRPLPGIPLRCHSGSPCAKKGRRGALGPAGLSAPDHTFPDLVS
jgi:hypothetical protein